MGQLPNEIRKALVNNRGQFKSYRVQSAVDYAKKKNIKVTKKDIMNYIKEIDEVTEHKVNFRKGMKHFVFNFLGGFVADIAYSRNEDAGKNVDGYEIEDGEYQRGAMKYFLLIVHGNSGWATAYQLNKKNRREVTRALSHFVSEMRRKYKYPVRKILTDNDKCFPESGKIPITKVTAEIHHRNDAGGGDIIQANHRLFTKIDNFMSTLRTYAANLYNKGHNSDIGHQAASPDRQLYIPYSVLQQFIHQWNQHVIPNVRCSREEMMRDPDLEKAYICLTLYANQGKEKIREEIRGQLTNSTEVTLKPRKGVFNNRQMGNTKQKPGTYRIEQVKGNVMMATNTRNPGDVVYFHPDDVAGIMHRDKWEEERDKYKDIDDPINDPRLFENEVPHVNTLPEVEDEPEEEHAPPKRRRGRPRKEQTEKSQGEKDAEVARAMLINDTMNNGLRNELSPEAIWQQTQKVKEAREQAENRESHPIDIDAGPEKIRKMTKEQLRKLLDHLIEQAKANPFWHQDVIVSKTEELANLVKSNKLRNVNLGTTATQLTKNNRARKQNKRARSSNGS